MKLKNELYPFSWECKEEKGGTEEPYSERISESLSLEMDKRLI
jgi:hypothetical protein